MQVFMLSRTTFQIIFASCIFVLLQGCMALESVTTNWPYVEDARVDHFKYGDGIALKLPGICFAVQEGDSAERKIEYIGPLLLTIFPAHYPNLPVAGYYEIKLDFLPDKEYSMKFDPAQVTLLLDNGLTLRPYAYGVWHFYSRPNPVADVPKLGDEIILRTTITRVSLRFEKLEDNAQVSKLLLKGLKNETDVLDVPTILFESKQAHYRYRWPSRGWNLDVKCR